VTSLHPIYSGRWAHWITSMKSTTESVDQQIMRPVIDFPQLESVL